MDRLLRAALAASLSILLVAGGSLAIVQSDDDLAALQAAPWTLTELDGLLIPADAGVTAEFGADGSLAGSGGCNRYSGSYTTSGSTISVTPLAATRIACQPDVMDIEDQFLDLLESAASWSVFRGLLEVTAANGGVLVFAGEGAEEPAPFAGTVWHLVSIRGTDASGYGATATFGEVFSVTGSGGCNRYFGDYTVDGSSIAIGPLAATRMACDSDVMEVERTLLDQMEQASSFAIAGRTLTLSSDDGGVDVVFSADAFPTGGSLTGVNWALVDLDGVEIFADDGIRVAFGEDGSISGFGGCNELFGSFTSDATTITVEGIASTRRFCGSEIMDIEGDLLAILYRAETWATQDDLLTITADDGAVLTFLAVDEPIGPAEPTPDPVDTNGVVGPVWQLATLQGAPIPAAIVSVTISFGADGTVSGSGGCNDFTGTYTLDGTAMSITTTALTQASCGSAVDQIEQGVLTVLPFLDSAEIIDGALHLVNDAFDIATVWQPL